MIDDAFTYREFVIAPDRRTVSFNYNLQNAGSDHDFSEKLVFPVDLPDNTQINAALRALHVALGVSYYKIFVSPAIIHPYEMSESEAAFWNNVWQGGLGEFLFVNHLSSDRLAKFKAQPGKLIKDSFGQAQPNGKVVMGIGGGKDSIVAGELLKSLGMEVNGFVMATGEQLGQTQKVATTMGVPLHVVERTLDPKLLEVQQHPDAFKGHIPISLIFGLVGTVLALSTNATSVVVANEASASIPRITWEDRPVNHQWSKSFGFEQQLQQLVHDEISGSISYFSAIRPLTSIAVAKVFAKLSQYYEVFTSDNFIFRIDPAKRPNARWSLESPKSLSSFILLAPWVSEQDMLRIFGRNFLDEASLETLFGESVGHQGHPPLDCVGTVDELVLSLNLAFNQGKYDSSYLVMKAREWGVIRDNTWNDELNDMLQLQPEQAYPPHISDLFINRLKEMLK